jgi:hypothetical protein
MTFDEAVEQPAKFPERAMAFLRGHQGQRLYTVMKSGRGKNDIAKVRKVWGSSKEEVEAQYPGWQVEKE